MCEILEVWVLYINMMGFSFIRERRGARSCGSDMFTVAQYVVGIIFL